MKEIWKAIEGYKGCYKVSNMGHVKSEGKVGHNPYGAIFKYRDITLKPEICKKWGYHRVCLQYYGKRKHIRIHRLVAVAFIPNPENKPEVNHINGIKSDNRACNLEWVTSSENTIHALNNGLKIHSKNGKFIKSNNLKQKT